MHSVASVLGSLPNFLAKFYIFETKYKKAVEIILTLLWLLSVSENLSNNRGVCVMDNIVIIVTLQRFWQW